MSRPASHEDVPYLLYTAATPNGFKASIMLEELGVKYEVRAMNLEAGEQKKAYLDLNPNGCIPTLVDRSAGNFVVFESGTILVYPAEKANPTIHKVFSLDEAAGAMGMLQDRSVVGKVLLSTRPIH